MSLTTDMFKNNEAIEFENVASVIGSGYENTGDDIKHKFKPKPKQYELIRTASM